MNELDIHNIRLADFDDNFNKTRQSASDVILQEGGRSYHYSDASQKITSELAEVISDVILVDVSQLADGPKEHPLQSNSRLSSLR